MATTSGKGPSVKAGDTIEGRYRIIKAVGEGGMGTVFLAEHVLIKRRVAVKILHPQFATDAGVIERFMNEARAAGTLGHPNIVESTDMGFTRDNIPYIVFEYLEGALLTDEIYRVKGMPARRALRIGVQIASALQAAHAAGIVHRDLKSDNIFLTDKDEASDHVKVLDFGISRFLEAESDSSQGGRGTTMGTPEFMAPEQITAPESVDARADIYALGVVLYEMLTARRPFSNDNVRHRETRRRMPEMETLLNQIVHDPPPALGRPDAPPGLQELIHDKLLAKDPAHRFQSMKDVQAAFEAFTGVSRRDSQPIVALQFPIEAPPPVASVVGVTPPKRNLARLWLVAAIVAGLAGGGAMFATGSKAPASTIQAMTGLQADADKIAATLDSEAHAAHLRADGIATTPMLRAAIETDAATVRDMAKNESLFKPAEGEVLEVFQLRDGKAISMLRIPESAAEVKPIAGTETRVETDGKQITVVASAPITKQQQTGVGGSLAIAVRVDLAEVRRAVAGHALAATLVGLEQPVVLAGPASPPPGKAVSVPIAPGRDAKLSGMSLAAVIALPSGNTGDLLQMVRDACWGVGGILLLVYVGSLLRSRTRA